MTELPPRMREILFYRVVLGMTRKEIEFVTGLGAYAIWKMEGRARKLLGARSPSMLAAVLVAHGIFAPETVLLSAEIGPPPLWVLGKKMAHSQGEGGSV